MPQSTKSKLSQKGWCKKKPRKLQFKSNFNTENVDVVERYESTEVYRRTWLHVRSGTTCSTSSDTHQVVEVWKETST